VQFFKSKPLLDPDTIDWIFSTYQWALHSFSTAVFYEHTELVLPTDQFFPDILEERDAVAESLFTRVRKYAGMEDWPCVLEPLEEDASPIIGQALLIVGAPQGPAGTFSIEGGELPTIKIAYNPSQLNHPQSLVATLAHELAHYLMHSVDTLPPGGEEHVEPATDLVAVFMGFGVFLTNSAFSFNQYSGNDTIGWQTSTQGYLSTAELAFCLAIFLKLKDISFTDVEPYLDRNSKKYVKTALKELNQKVAEIEQLKSIESQVNEHN